jgi:lysophospholipase L1-like esterase
LVATLLVPVVVLGGLELALRWAGFGASRPLFVDAANAPGYRHAGSDVMWRYYTATQEVAASIDPILFRSEKPADVLRLVVQGASSAAGFPYGRWAGLAGMLADRIEASHPHLSIEVITTAMAAVSTYTLLDLVDEIIAVEPDAVLIYAGHNEYLGVMGVASSLAGGASRPVALLRLRLGGLRLYQLVDALIRRVRATPATGSDRQSLFERAAAGSRVAPGSELDARGVAQLESNLSAILERYRAAGIPVYLATLVSNERDQPPFSGGPSADVDPDAWLQGWMRHDAFRLAERDAQARAELESLLVLDDEAADVWYALGGLEERAGDFERARVA